VDGAGVVSLGLGGELDIATSGELRDRLKELAAAPGKSVVIDLRWLEFIDSSGVRELIRAVSWARRDGWSLTFDDTVGPQVLRVIDLLGLRDLLWPPG